MKKIYFLFVVTCMLVASSCCTMRTTSDTKTVKPETGDIIADLDVRSQKISETLTVKIKNRNISIRQEEILKENAVFNALNKINADMLIAPQYQVSKDKCTSSTTFTVVVTGYPAYYTNFRQMPLASGLELRELKEGASYVVVEKGTDSSDKAYKDVIVVPVRKGCNTLELDEMTLERVVLDGNGTKMRGCKKDGAPKSGRKATLGSDDDDKKDKKEEKKATEKKKGWDSVKSAFTKK